MEEDCEEHGSSVSQTPPAEMSTFFTSFSSQLSGVMDQLQTQMKATDMRLAATQEAFHQEIRSEMDTLRNMVVRQSLPTAGVSQSTTSVLFASTSSSSPTVSMSSTTSHGHVSPPPQVSSLISNDVQAQLLLTLTESFSKMSAVLTDRSSDTKTDWSKFSGDTKKFKSWYLSIVAQLSLAPWNEFYDHTTNMIVTITTNQPLNAKLYAKLLVALEGQALQDIVSRSHLRANGLLLLHELVQTYKPKNVPEVLAAKAGEFWSKIKRSPNETVDSYYNRFHDLLDDLSQAEDRISTKSAMHQFIFTLGSEFHAIQTNYRIGNLPQEWNTTDWPTLLVLCRDYYNSVNPKGIHSGDQGSATTDSHASRMAQQKKVREWFLNPVKFREEIEREQKCHPDKCIYHLTKSHPTATCFVKLECDKQVQASKTVPASNSSTSGTLRHITEEIFEDAILDTEDMHTTEERVESNDTNEDSLQYFALVTKHYLRLANVSSTMDCISRHDRSYPVIADIGANCHMFKEREFFSSLIQTTGKVLLGDGKTSLTIQGIGTVTCKLGQHKLVIPNVRYIPELGESIYSLFQHIQSPEHGLHSSFEGGLSIIFPKFSTQAIIGDHDIYLDIVPCSTSLSVSDDILIQSETTSSVPDNFCRNVIQLQQNLLKETNHIDGLLCKLRHYYQDVKTKRQLGLDVPAGFRVASQQEQNRRALVPPCK